MFKIRLFPISILLLGLGITFIISYSAFRDMNQLSRQKFEADCQELENKIQIQLKANAQILYSSAAFISSSDSITRAEWREFQYLNKSHRELPGIRGIGYSVVVPKHQVTEFEKRIGSEGYPEFKVRPAGQRDIYTSVVYIEPFSKLNLYALGYDAYTDPVRKRAMDWALNHDLATISDKVVLIRDLDGIEQVGAIMFAPVFKRGLPKETTDERKSALLGWVYSPFEMDDLLKNTLGQWDYESIRLKAYDDEAMVPEKLLFDSDVALNVNHATEPEFIYNIPLNFNNKLWMLSFNRYSRAEPLLSSRIIFVIVNGVIFSVLLFVLVASLISARTRSVQIQVLNDELRKANMNKDRFISVLAHDLKSPFNALLGFSELLAENFDDYSKEESGFYANRLYATAKFTYSLLEELLLWARLQSDQFPFSPERLHLNELCKNLIDDYTLLAEEKGITLSSEAEDLYVKADEFMLKTILRNLLGNAIKFTREGGTINLKAVKDGNNVIVSVSDSGIGMSPEEISKLFDISRVHSKLGTANEKGTGLGLMLCRDLVGRNGGDLWVESAAGVGSVFRFSVPVADN